MKKRAAFLGTGLAAAAICTAMAMNVFAAEITEDRAKAIALENAGVTQDQTTYIHAKLDYDDGRQRYEVEFFTSDYKEYDYEIDAVTGNIISVDYDAEITYFYDNGRAGNRQAVITSEEAKAAAVSHSGVKEEDIPFIHVKLDYDDGRQNYEVEFYTSDNKEYDYEINGTTGEIISWDYDAEKFYQLENNGKGKGNGTGTISTAVTEAQAKAKALETAGLTDSQVTWGKIKLDYDDRHLVYDGKFIFGTMEYEFEVDADTGNIVDWDVESIYD